MITINKLFKSFCFSNYPSYKLPENTEIAAELLRRKIVSLTSCGNLNLQNGRYITKKTIDLRRKNINDYVFNN